MLDAAGELMGGAAKALKMSDPASTAPRSRNNSVIRAERLEMPRHLRAAISKSLRVGKAARQRKK